MSTVKKEASHLAVLLVIFLLFIPLLPSTVAQCKPLKSPSKYHEFNYETCTWHCRPLKCKTMHFFDEKTCSCQCPTAGRAPTPKYQFNPKTCQWQCPESIFCPKGTLVNRQTCTCIPTPAQQTPPSRAKPKITGKTVSSLKFFCEPTSGCKILTKT